MKKLLFICCGMLSSSLFAMQNPAIPNYLKLRNIINSIEATHKHGYSQDAVEMLEKLLAARVVQEIELPLSLKELMRQHTTTVNLSACQLFVSVQDLSSKGILDNWVAFENDYEPQFRPRVGWDIVKVWKIREPRHNFPS